LYYSELVTAFSPAEYRQSFPLLFFACSCKGRKSGFSAPGFFVCARQILCAFAAADGFSLALWPALYYKAQGWRLPGAAKAQPQTGLS